MLEENRQGYQYDSAQHSCAHGYLLPTVKRELDEMLEFRGAGTEAKRVFDLGCGNGSVANFLSTLGWSVVGIDPSDEGITHAKKEYPELTLNIGSAYDDLLSKYGTFLACINLEVVEHVYAPRIYAKTLFNLVEPGGIAIVSTPYHGYMKNVALALSGNMDQHFTALWDHGHIKFWSIATLGELLKEAGFFDLKFYRVGRVPQLAKSMIAVARKP